MIQHSLTTVLHQHSRFWTWIFKTFYCSWPTSKSFFQVSVWPLLLWCQGFIPPCGPLKYALIMFFAFSIRHYYFKSVFIWSFFLWKPTGENLFKSMQVCVSTLFILMATLPTNGAINWVDIFLLFMIISKKKIPDEEKSSAYLVIPDMLSHQR